MTASSPGPRPGRRGLLLAAAGAGVLAACGKSEPSGPGQRLKKMPYGEGEWHVGMLGTPAAEKPRATVVMVHGGGWLANASLVSFLPMQRALMALGYATWSVEYRGVGVGGGFPGTFEDVAAGVDHLASIGRSDSGYDEGILTEKVVYLGQSAGAQLAVWAASRTRRTPGGPPKLKPLGAISLAGPLNLALAAQDQLGGTLVPDFMGGMPAEVPEHYALGDPTKLVPASCPVWALRGNQDAVVTAEEGTSYVQAARAAGGSAYYVPTIGTHSTILQPAGASWNMIRALLARATGG